MNEELKAKIATLIQGTEFPKNPQHYFEILMEFGLSAYSLDRADGWVSVSEKLPDTSRWVRVKGQILPFWYSNKRWYEYATPGEVNYLVKEWQDFDIDNNLLPTPPNKPNKQ